MEASTDFIRFGMHIEDIYIFIYLLFKCNFKLHFYYLFFVHVLYFRSPYLYEYW